MQLLYDNNNPDYCTAIETVLDTDTKIRIYRIIPPIYTAFKYIDTDHSVSSAAFTPNGTKIVTASRNGPARVWDALTGYCLLTSSGQYSVASATFSPDSNFIVTEAYHETAQLWDCINWALLTFLNS